MSVGIVQGHAWVGDSWFKKKGGGWGCVTQEQGTSLPLA